MKAHDVMVSPAITVKSRSSVKDVAKLLLEHRISAVPVVDDDGRLVGIVSEGDLLHRTEAGTERHRPWWLQALVGNETLADEFVKSHSRRVSDVMTKDVITARPDTPLHEIAALLEKKMIKRVPIVDQKGHLLGIVSRANLIQALANERLEPDVQASDAAIRDALLNELKNQEWAHTQLLNVTVTEGVVSLWGMTDSGTEQTALRVAAEAIPGVRAVNDNLLLRPRIAAL
jgi:CBS domain-containing protein